MSTAAYFPVGITPTKPLTPTHVRGLLHLDALLRLHRRCEPAILCHNRRLWDLSQQTLQFWGWLDSCHPGKDYTGFSADDIGQLYVDWARSGHRLVGDELQALWRLTHDEGYVHRASQVLLDAWLPQVDMIGVDTGMLQRSHVPPCSEAELLEALARLGLLIDQRGVGGGLYADLTSQGGGLRQLVSDDGVPNYLMGMLREVLLLVRQQHRLHLFHDSSVERDFIFIERFVQGLGGEVTRISFPRVTIDGQALSYRQGGGFHTLSSMLAHARGKCSPREMRLALRLMFLQMHGIRRAFDFTWAGFDRAIASARAIVEELDGATPACGEDARQVWRALRRRDGTMNVLGALTLLASGRERAPIRAALLECLIDESPA